MRILVTAIGGEPSRTVAGQILARRASRCKARIWPVEPGGKLDAQALIRLLLGGPMTDTHTLVPARQLAETNTAHFPNESAGYRAARNALLVEEIELRRHIERVASQRRALPSGGRRPRDFQHDHA